jgi:hypothetical protein
MASADPKAPRVKPEHRESTVHKVPKVSLASKDYKESLGNKDHRVLKALRVCKVYKVQEHKASKVCKEKPVHKV